MSVVDGGSSSGLVQRVQDILLRPKPTWDVIDGEPATTKGLYTGYAMILAAIPAVCGFLGAALLGGLGFGLFAIIVAAVSYVLGLVSVYVLGLIIDALAPSFDGTKSPIQAQKVAVYANTASWVAGVLTLIPVIGGFLAGLGGLYGLYLLYLGLPPLMKSPKEKTLGYAVVVIVCAIVLWVVALMILGTITAMGIGAAAIGAAAVSH